MLLAEFDTGHLAATEFCSPRISGGNAVRAFADAMLASSLGNPHSGSPSARRSAEAVEGARRAVLDYFGASGRDYAGELVRC
ncbi:hypothetical protein T484DRAFT_1805190 [Baffinella frigidus]|nr:hypothetical protein T484DRAFT_1805190 [Cryptophyta sp. CCMP2293]